MSAGRVSWLALLLACAGAEGPPATARFVGAETTLTIALRGAALEVPVDAATTLEAELTGPGRAWLTLGGAGLGATEDALLDAAEEDLRALVPGASLRREPVRWWGRTGRAVVAERAGVRRERRVLMRSPWRVATLRVEGDASGIDAAAGADASASFDATADPALAFLGLRLGDARWRLDTLRLAGDPLRLALGASCAGAFCRGCGHWRLEGRAPPGESDRALRRVWRRVRCR